jgi:hypothetical protein
MKTVLEFIEWDGTEKQVMRYKWFRRAIDENRILLNCHNCFTDSEGISSVPNMFDYDRDYILTGDYIIYYRKSDSVILCPKKEFEKNYIEVLK